MIIFKSDCWPRCAYWLNSIGRFVQRAFGLLLLLAAYGLAVCAAASEPLPSSDGWQPPIGHPLRSISPDGKWGMFSSQKGKEFSVKICDLHNGSTVLDSWDSAVQKLDFSSFYLIWGPNDLCSYWDGEHMKVYSLRSKTVVATLPVNHRYNGGRLYFPSPGAFTPTGDQIVFLRTEEKQHSIEVWDIAGKRMLRTFDVTAAPPRQLAVSPDGRELFQLTQSGSRLLLCRSLETGKVIRSLELPVEWFRYGASMLLSPGGKYIGLSGTEGARVLRTADFGLQATMGPAEGLVVPSSGIFQMTFSRDGNYLVTDTAGLPVWNIEANRLEGGLADNVTTANRLLLSPKGECVGGFDTGPERKLRWYRMSARGSPELLLAFAKQSEKLKPQVQAPKSAVVAKGSATMEKPVSAKPGDATQTASIPDPLITPTPADPMKEAEKAFAAGFPYYIWVEEKTVARGRPSAFLSLALVKIRIETAPNLGKQPFRWRSEIITLGGGSKDLSVLSMTSEQINSGESSQTVTIGGDKLLTGNGVAAISLVAPKGKSDAAKQLSNTVFVGVEFKY